MPENQTETTEKGTGEIVSAGNITPFSFTDVKAPVTEETPDNAGENNDATKEKEDQKPTIPELSDDQLKEILKGKGIVVDGDFEALKNKLHPTPEATEEEKKQAQTQKELAAQQIFINQGGTIEQFAALKEVAAADEKELSKHSLRAELIAAGIDEDEIERVIEQRYFQIKLDELKIDEEETDKEFAVRKAKLEKLVKYGTEKLDSRGKTAKAKAETTLNNLYKALETSDLQKREAEQEEKTISSKVDEISKNAPKKLTFSLGKDDKQVDIPAFEFDVKEEDIASVAAEFRDPAIRNNILYSEDGTLKVDELFDLRLKNKLLEKAVHAAYLEGGTRQTEIVRRMFPHSASELGIGASPKNGKGKGEIVSAGNPQPMGRPQQR